MQSPSDGLSFIVEDHMNLYIGKETTEGELREYLLQRQPGMLPHIRKILDAISAILLDPDTSMILVPKVK